MKRIILIILLLMVSATMWADESFTLEGIYKPEFVIARGDKVYITEGAKIHIFSIPEKKVVKTFGKQGEGPQEFKVLPGIGVRLDFKGDKMIVFSISKVSTFSKDGTFISESKNSNFLNRYQVVGDNYIGMGFRQGKTEGAITMNLYDKEMKKLKELSSFSFTPGKRFEILKQGFYYQAHGSNVVVAKSAEFDIEVLDLQGNKKFSITKPYERLIMTEERKNEIWNWYRTNPRTKAYFEQIKKGLGIPDKLPAIRSLNVDGDTLYVQSYHQKEGKTEFFLFHLEGDKARFIKTLWLPIHRSVIVEEAQWFNFNNGKLYQVVEDEDEEAMTLQISEAK